MVKFLKTSLTNRQERRCDFRCRGRHFSSASKIVTLLRTLTLHKQSPSYAVRSPSIHRYYEKKSVEKEMNRFDMTRDLFIVYSQKEGVNEVYFIRK